MTPTFETRAFYMKAMGLAACARSFVGLGMWGEASRVFNQAQEYWYQVEWQQ